MSETTTPKPASELLSCPFCGIKTALMESAPCNDPPEGDILLNSFNIMCGQCHCIGPSTGEYETAIAAWNNRHSADVLDRVLAEVMEISTRDNEDRLTISWLKLKKIIERLRNGS